MLFEELLRDERREGQSMILKLVEIMCNEGLQEQISRLSKEPEFLEEMLNKYEIE